MLSDYERDALIASMRKMIRENELRGRTELARHYRGELTRFKNQWGGV